ncbi:MAG: Gfo/Idh/MocA family oxidoreductase [Verrucomicrobiales bacterium]|nr:Gfo/Idh/MocA family oxidoreductase [Verrucomicrobiales bacterium]
MNASEIRVGLIGAGGIVKQRHMPGLRSIEGVRIAAVANRREETAQAFVREWAPEARVESDWRAVAQAPDVDVVWIGAPPYLHRQAVCAALAAGKHVFCQARMAASLEDAAAMREAAASRPSQVAALCPAPHGMAARLWVKRSLAEGVLGRLIHADLRSWNGAYLDPSAPMHWRQDREISGIQVLTLGIYVEVLQDWLGAIQRVRSRGLTATPMRSGRRVEIPDQVEVQADFEAGLTASLSFSAIAAHAAMEELWLWGSEGTLHYDFTKEEARLGGREGSMQTVVVPASEQREWTVERDFIAAVRDAAAPRPRPDFEEGWRYMRVVDAVDRGRTSSLWEEVGG